MIFLGPVFGSKDYFMGLAIILDTYSNHNGPHNVSITLMDKSFVRSTNEVTFSVLVAHQYENGIVKKKTL